MDYDIGKNFEVINAKLDMIEQKMDALLKKAYPEQYKEVKR